MAGKTEKLTNAKIRMFLNSGCTCEELVRVFHLAQKRVAGVKRGLDNLSNAQIRMFLNDGCSCYEITRVFKLNRKRVEDISLKMLNRDKPDDKKPRDRRHKTGTEANV